MQQVCMSPTDKAPQPLFSLVSPHPPGFVIKGLFFFFLALSTKVLGEAKSKEMFPAG